MYRIIACIWGLLPECLKVEREWEKIKADLRACGQWGQTADAIVAGAKIAANDISEGFTGPGISNATAWDVWASHLAWCAQQSPPMGVPSPSAFIDAYTTVHKGPTS